MKALVGLAVLVLLGGVAYWLYIQKPMEATLDTGTQVATGAVQSSDVNYFAEVSGLYARPSAPGDYPGVVLIHENRGLRPEIRTAAETLAKEGYHVLAVDLYNGTVMETQDEARAFAATFDQQTGIANMRAAVAYLREQGATKVGSWGWCFGGAQSLQLAMSGEDMAATVIYYGSRPVTDVAQLSVIKWPVLGIYGDQDQAIPQDTLAAFDKALTDAGVEHTFHIYPGVGHAFANPSNPNHHPAHTADAWAKTLAFLNKNLK